MKIRVNKYQSCLTTANARIGTYGGRKHLILPATILREGVWCGSGGCLLYTSEELSKFPSSWDGRPLPAPAHPVDSGGRHISANSPEVIDRQSVGRLWNTHFEGDALKTEFWIDPERAARVAPEILQTIREGKPLGLSTGLFCDDLPQSGTYAGKKYDAVATNIRPDHCAIIFERGACSISDGCFAKTNCKNNCLKEKKTMDYDSEPLELPRMYFDADRDALDKVKAHLERTIGKAADSRLKTMSAADVEAMAAKIGHEPAKRPVLDNGEDESPLETPTW